MPLKPLQTPSPPVAGTRRKGISYSELYPIDTLGRSHPSPLLSPSPTSPRVLPRRESSKDDPEHQAAKNSERTTATNTDGDFARVPEEKQEEDKNIVGINEASDIVTEKSRPSVLDQASRNGRESSSDGATNPAYADDKQDNSDRQDNSQIERVCVDMERDVTEDDDVFHNDNDAVQNDHVMLSVNDPVVKRPPPAVLPKPFGHVTMVTRADLMGSQSSSFDSYLQMEPLDEGPKLRDPHLDHLEAETSFLHPIHQLNRTQSVSMSEIDKGNSSPTLRKPWTSARSRVNVSNSGSMLSMNMMNKPPEFSSDSSFLPTYDDDHVSVHISSDVTESDTDNQGVFIPGDIAETRYHPFQSPTPESLPGGGVFVPDDSDQRLSDSEGIFVPDIVPHDMPSLYHIPLHAANSITSQEHSEMSDSTTGYASAQSTLSIGGFEAGLQPSSSTGMSSQVALTSAPSTTTRNQSGKRWKVLFAIGLLSVLVLVLLAIGIPIVFSLNHRGEGEQQDQIIIFNCPLDIVKQLHGAERTSVVSWREPTAVDQEGRPAKLLYQSHQPGVALSEGPSEVTYSFVNQHYLGNAKCSFTIMVLPPVFDAGDDNDDEDTSSTASYYEHLSTEESPTAADDTDETEADDTDKTDEEADDDFKR